jgi:hypothetical protein
MVSVLLGLFETNQRFSLVDVVEKLPAIQPTTARVTLEDGQTRTLRREVTHAIHNAAKISVDQVGKVWGRKTTRLMKLPFDMNPRSARI